MDITSRDILIPFTMGLMVNILSFYLLTLQIISIQIFIYIIIGFFLLILLIGIQLKYNTIKKELEKVKSNYKHIDEKLKINERLAKLELKVKSNAKRT